MGGVRHTEPIQ